MRRAARCLIVALCVLTSCSLDSGPRDLGALPGGAGRTPGTDATPRKAHGGPVLAIGDSILIGTTEHGDLGNKLFADAWTLETVAEAGRSVRWAIDRVRLREKVPPYIVLVLGSNPGFSSVGFFDDVQSLRDALVARGARRIVWIPPHAADATRYVEKDRILTEADQADGRIVVPDWGKALEENPDFIGGDGLHLTERGYDALASFIREALEKLG